MMRKHRPEQDRPTRLRVTAAGAAGLWGTRTIADELHAVAAAHPERDAVVALGGRLSFRELDERSDALAVGLAGLGLEPGDPVLFQVSNRLDTVLAWYGVLKAGLVPVCTLAAHRGHEAEIAFGC